jgi:hypothetical protein
MIDVKEYFNKNCNAYKYFYPISIKAKNGDIVGIIEKI